MNMYEVFTGKYSAMLCASTIAEALREFEESFDEPVIAIVQISHPIWLEVTNENRVINN